MTLNGLTCPDCKEETTVMLPTGGRIGRRCKCLRDRKEQDEQEARDANVVVEPQPER